MINRIGVVGIVIEEKNSIGRINEILNEHGSIISGRMGIPNINNKGVNIISLVVNGTTDEIGSLAGKLGILKGVSVKSALSKKSYESNNDEER